MFFPLIDVLRGFAAISVVIFHIISHFNWDSFPKSGPLVWFRIGWVAVDLFFVISGFVISLSAFSTLDKTSDRILYYRHFIRHRLARIVPLHYLTCLVFIVFIMPFMFFDHRAWWHIITHLLFIHNLFADHQGSINGVNWSLAAEMQFYLVIMFLAPYLKKVPWWGILIGSMIVAWSWRAAVFLTTDLHGPTGVFHRFVFETQLPGMIDEFACGILLARFVRSESGKRFLTQNVQRLWLVPLSAMCLVYSAQRIFWHHATFWDSFGMVVFFRTYLAITCVSLVLLCCCFNQKIVVKLSAPLRYLGTISFGVYLWHLSVIMSFKHMDWLSGGRALPVIVIITIIFAVISWVFIEKPIMAYFSRKLPRND
ncbi:acyltransferase family protein [Asaia prunellae]|uniref:acyltransferase family protein n=1 Tax=Asaia prunellae TaxID=610245 RepID=UPI00047072BE